MRDAKGGKLTSLADASEEVKFTRTKSALTHNLGVVVKVKNSALRIRMILKLWTKKWAKTKD